jgi:L-lactate dehydrogenase complex protein LldG
MNSRELILERIKQRKPALSRPPTIPVFERTNIDLCLHFKEMLRLAGGQVIELSSNDNIADLITGIYPEVQKVLSNIDSVKSINVDINSISDAHQLHDIDLAVLSGEFGVAENAAVWIQGNSLPHRVIPFIAQHLVIELDKKQLVWNMHQAYQKLTVLPENGFGVFISGPSKTADIEQSLVIGAHGSRSLTVLLS